MTEQEAEVQVARLTRIWGLQDVQWMVASSPFAGKIEGCLHLYAVLGGGPQLSIEGYHWGALGCELLDETRTYVLDCDEQGQLNQSHFLYADATEDAHLQSQFAEKWLPFFRRNCWLSGCDIEASAHEKAEWMQGFTHKELQSWNLKL